MLRYRHTFLPKGVISRLMHDLEIDVVFCAGEGLEAVAEKTTAIQGEARN